MVRGDAYTPERFWDRIEVDPKDVEDAKTKGFCISNQNQTCVSKLKKKRIKKSI